MTFGAPATDRPKVPAKKWRTGKTDVAYAFEEAQSFTSEAKAYAAVRGLTGAGHAATVWHFEGHYWQTFEKIGADGQSV
jgi:hypothetical protein